MEMQTVSDIIAALGGSAAVSRKSGIPLTTIEGWKSANFIPEWRQPALLNVAKSEKVALTVDDLPPKPARRKAAA